MPKFRRYFVPGATYFFTVVTYNRVPIFRTEQARVLLGTKLRQCQAERPFRMPAVVLLPDHLHALWSLPEGDDEYPARWGRIKKEFTTEWLAHGGRQRVVTAAQARQRRRGVWQPRYWEHTIRDEDDFARHFDYIHYNPVKHGLVSRPRDWPYSSFSRWVEMGVYPPNWGEGPMSFEDLDESAME
jgi:putative transposase